MLSLNIYFIRIKFKHIFMLRNKWYKAVWRLNGLLYIVGHIESSSGSSRQREVHTACTWSRQGHSLVCGLLCSVVWSLPAASPTVEETGQGTIVKQTTDILCCTWFKTKKIIHSHGNTYICSRYDCFYYDYDLLILI